MLEPYVKVFGEGKIVIASTLGACAIDENDLSLSTEYENDEKC